MLIIWPWKFSNPVLHLYIEGLELLRNTWKSRAIAIFIRFSSISGLTWSLQWDTFNRGISATIDVYRKILWAKPKVQLDFMVCEPVRKDTFFSYYFSREENFCWDCDFFLFFTEIPMPSSSPKATEMKSNANKEGEIISNIDLSIHFFQSKTLTLALLKYNLRITTHSYREACLLKCPEHCTFHFKINHTPQSKYNIWMPHKVLYLHFI